MSRATACSPILFSLTAILIAAPAAPLAAQQRMEVMVRRGPRAERDTLEREVRRLHLRADSLSRVYGETTDAEERRRAGEALDQTVEQLDQIAMRVMDGDVRMMRLEPPRGMLAPMANGGAAAAMTQALTRSGVPRGWLGIVVSGAAREPWIERGELLIRYVTHPEIVSVEPSSPAERAGLVPSDTLIAYDGKDVTEGDISVTRLLKPNARVLVRIRRDGQTRDVPVKIASAPRRITIRVDEMLADRYPNAMAEAPAFPTAPFPPAAMLSPLPGFVPRGPRVPATSVSMYAPTVTSPGLPDGIAGAKMASITSGLGRSLGVSYGVLVVSAPIGSPAAESGLVDGDVIVEAAGQLVRTVSGLRELVGAAVEHGERSVTLETVRGKQKRKVVLRW
jgi:hypothetical protein